MKKIYLLAMLCSLTFGPFQLFSADNPDNCVSVEASASMETMPDSILINFVVSSENIDISAAKKKNEESLKKISEALKKYGITEKDIQIKNVSIALKREKEVSEKQYQQTQRQVINLSKNITDDKSYKQVDDSKGKINGYIVSNVFSVEVKNPEKTEDIIGACINAGVDDLNSVTFCITEQKKFRDELRNKALLEARAKAEKMASVLGRKLGLVTYIGNSESDSDMKCFDGAAPWTVTIKESVQVRFELK